MDDGFPAQPKGVGFGIKSWRSCLGFKIGFTVLGIYQTPFKAILRYVVPDSGRVLLTVLASECLTSSLLRVR